MIPAGPFGAHTVGVIARSQSPDGDWSSVTRTVVPGCSVQPAGSTGDTDESRQQGTQRFAVFGPPALAAARAGDHLEVPGYLTGAGPAAAVLRVEGPPAIWPDEHGQPHHVEAAASLVTG